MLQANRTLRILDAIWLLAWGLAASVWCLTAGHELGGTFDEPVYLKCGLDHWRTGSPAPLMKLGTMPLPVDVVTLPLYVRERWTGAKIDTLRDWASILPWARAGTLVFWWLLLIYGWKAAGRLAGPWASRLVVPLLACEPNLLAHSALATTDIAISACLLALAYSFWTGRDSSWPRRVLVPALWFGLALLAKASALVFGPICLLVVGLEHLVRRQVLPGLTTLSWRVVIAETWRQLRPLRTDLTTVFLGGLGLTFVYVGSDWKPEASFVAWARALPAGSGRTATVWLAENLRIFSNAGVGLVHQITHNMRGHGAYILGYSHPRAIWFYFPALLTIKVTIPLLAATLAIVLTRPRALVSWPCLAAAALLALSFTFRVQIGFRLILPPVVLALVGLAVALTETIAAGRKVWRGRLAVGLTVAGVCWMLVTAIHVWPHGLCYVNELWGGTEHGFVHVSEANYDWGQGLPELGEWQQQHGIARLAVCYFGSDPLLNRLPLDLVPLYSLPLQKPDDLPRMLHSRFLAISTTMLYGAFGDTAPMRQARVYLRQMQPVGRTTTFLIYDFSQAEKKEDPVIQKRNPTDR